MLFSTSALTLSPATGITDPCFTSFPHSFNGLWNSHKPRLLVTPNCPHPRTERLNFLFWPQPAPAPPVFLSEVYFFLSLAPNPSYFKTSVLVLYAAPSIGPALQIISLWTYLPTSLTAELLKVVQVEKHKCLISSAQRASDSCICFQNVCLVCFYDDQGRMLDVGNSEIKEERTLSSSSSQINGKLYTFGCCALVVS